jgi:hypothetical protein
MGDPNRDGEYFGYNEAEEMLMVMVRGMAW